MITITEILKNTKINTTKLAINYWQFDKLLHHVNNENIANKKSFKIFRIFLFLNSKAFMNLTISKIEECRFYIRRKIELIPETKKHVKVQIKIGPQRKC